VRILRCPKTANIRHQKKEAHDLPQKRTKTREEEAEIVFVRPEPGGLSQAQYVAITALSGGCTITQAANDAGVSRETVSRWLNHDPAFQAELNRCRAVMLQELDDGLRAMTAQAMETLENLMGASTHPELQLKAALAVLHLADGTRRRIGPKTEAAVRAEAQLNDILSGLGN
jgi:hypothetical protein